ncbi:MAG: DUF4433 domain-containing protein [Armatimonadota bacterium]|nr:DUF4433 domain-containing protein [bacterium]MDW8320604.1 DUF4433 domain-containing protein [Armatimonadota bacterium]
MERIRIYHITHHSNLPRILTAGGLLCDKEASDGCAVSIAYADLKQRREHVAVPCEPGGVLADYVPFYFAPRSPMLYAIHKGFVSHYAGGQNEIVYIASSVQTVQRRRLPFVFTDGHPVVRITRFFNRLNNLNQLDWQIMRARAWHNTEDDPDRKRRRQAEFLVYRFFPWEAVEMLGVVDLEMRERVLTYLHDHAQQSVPPVYLRSSWYY